MRGGTRFLAAIRPDQQIGQRGVRLSELRVQGDGTLRLLDREREQRRVRMVAMARHLVAPEVRVREADVRSRNTRIEVDRALEVLDGHGDVGCIQRLELQPSFHECAIRVEAGGFAPWAPARGRRLGAVGVNRCDEAVSPLRHSLDVRRPGAIVPERLPEIRYRLRQRVLGDHDVRPERLKQFLFGNKRRRPGDEVVEQVDQFRRERHWHIAALERERSGVQREGTEPVQHGDDSKPKSPAASRFAT